MRRPTILSSSTSNLCPEASCCTPSGSYGGNCAADTESRRGNSESRQAIQLGATSKDTVSDIASAEEMEEEPCVSGASAAPSDGIMAIYQQFRHLWARSAQPAHSSSRRGNRSYTQPSAPQPQPAQPPVPPAQAPAPASLQQLDALQQPLPILLPLFGMSAAAA
ncbi:hypothetical protein COCOBI_09-5270 [Coccomyxa sp. Obi]|nr:hypothetical protein COCOBI_09-5270 [Coccomyxa sp. Obi]